ncbi:hypothetical protein D6D28_06605 [Aureobasidium pullulans]|uniref:Uncharacterized protein n=1 Tax=Aureobasidium pullulans TaxID=5580 RepID=A0A4S8SE36_AURPU|nr:hypothetical protein D6D28_06605 [Aureobasidium pullulans]
MRARLHSERGRRGGHTLRPLRLDEHEIGRSNVNRRDDWDFERDTAASQNSPFHIFIQTTDPDQEDLELKWLTLAVGMPYIRETQADEYLAAWYYQLEAMLASALESFDEKSNDYKFRGIQWWPFDSADTTEAWKGADHHCSIRDIWAKRPTMRTEDEIAERETAARVVETTRVRKQQRAAVEGNMYLCTHTGCEREQRGRGFGSIQALQGHHAWHNRDIAIAEDCHLCTITGCDRAILGRGLATPLALQQHMVFRFKLGNDAYLCTYDQCGRSQAGKGFKTLQTLERHLTRYYQLGSSTSPMRVTQFSTSMAESNKQIIISDSATESLAEASLQHTHLVEHRAERRKSRKADKEEHSREDNADQAGIVARRPRTIKSVLEKAKLLPLTATNRDGQWAQGFVAHLRLIKTEVGSRWMVGLQKLLAFAFSIIDAGALATSAAFARESAGIIGLYKDIVATEGPGGAHHYSSLANSLVNTAHVYSEFENELQDKKSSEYQKYKAAVEGHKKERVRGVFGEHGEGHRPGLSEDKQLAKSHFTKMEKLLNTALALSYLGDAFGPGIHALMIASD